MRLAAVLNAPAPYTTPILNQVAKHVDLHAIYLEGDNEVNRFANSWGVPPEYAHSVSWARRIDISSIDFHIELSAGAARRLRAFRPDAIVLVSWRPSALEPLLWSRASRTAAVMWAESTEFSGLLRGRMSTTLRQWLASAYDAYVSNGSQATRYLESLGVPSRRIVTSRLPAGMRAETTNRAGGSDVVRFLFVGRLTAQKRAAELIEAFAAVRAAIPNTELTVVGAGPLTEAIRGRAARTPGVRYVGHREGGELASIYSQSDVLVLPAVREVWGVVVNEALSHGLFVVTTDQVGSAYDLLDDERGVVLPADDLTQLAPTLIATAAKLDTSDAARHKRALVMAECTPERFASDIVRAADLALEARGGHRPRPHRAT